MKTVQRIIIEKSQQQQIALMTLAELLENDAPELTYHVHMAGQILAQEATLVALGEADAAQSLEAVTAFNTAFEGLAEYEVH